jgi:outer membrane protein assembly factor BamE (lipoprotein component of BamABCDE complex)
MRIANHAAMAAMLLLAGCAVGVNFVKPSDDQLIVGTSTEESVLASLGKPNLKSTKVVNGETLNMDTYAYAKVGGEAVFPGVTPARSLALVFKDGVLVEKGYSSSFKQDSTYFDVEKAKAIKPGMPAAAVSTLLGHPGGEAIYPVSSTMGHRNMEYVFAETRGFKSQRNTLVVEVDADGKVVKSDYTQVGQL